jgi:hypothetical protein
MEEKAGFIHGLTHGNRQDFMLYILENYDTHSPLLAVRLDSAKQVDELRVAFAS